jgi:hypothetical protein
MKGMSLTAPEARAPQPPNHTILILASSNFSQLAKSIEESFSGHTGSRSWRSGESTNRASNQCSQLQNKFSHKSCREWPLLVDGSLTLLGHKSFLSCFSCPSCSTRGPWRGGGGSGRQQEGGFGACAMSKHLCSYAGLRHPVIPRRKNTVRAAGDSELSSWMKSGNPKDQWWRTERLISKSQ